MSYMFLQSLLLFLRFNLSRVSRHICNLHSIELPPAIPKSSFERDLDFYGLVPEEGGIKHNSIADVMVSLRGERDSSKMKHDMFLFAVEVNHQYTITKKSSDAQESVEIVVSKLVTSISTGCSNGYLSEADKKLLLKYLDEYFGLKLSPGNIYIQGHKTTNQPHLDSRGYFYVTRK
jgi:hypothetical protein